MKFSRTLSLVILILDISIVRAQEVIIRAELDTNRSLIGDQIKLHLSAEKPSSLHVDFPLLQDTLTRHIEIISRSPIDTNSLAAGKSRLSQELLISVFDTGFYEIPALPFVVHSKEIPDTLHTLPVYFEIVALKADSTIRDIKAIYKVPVSFREMSPYFLLAIVLGVIGWFVIRYMRNRKNTQVAKPVGKIFESPDIIALREIDHLHEEKPWLYNKIKYYHIRISEILRTYIESRFRISALEQTTDEILASLKPPICKTAEISRLSALLKLSDLVKFAKVIPDAEENAAQIEYAAEFVRNTRVVETPEIQHNNNDSIVVESNHLS